MESLAASKRIIRVGHSPDPDDAFMFYAIAHKKIDLGPYVWQDVILDIETLNHKALKAELEVTAISVHAYAHVANHYAVMPCGASIGDQYGPILVAKKEISRIQLRTSRIAIPGVMTTAFLTLRICLGNFDYLVLPFDQIIDAVKEGTVDAGLIIHEGQLTYAADGLCLLLDLGKWWYTKTGLPLPLGIDVIRKDLPLADQVGVTQLFKESIQYALAHRPAALAYAMKYGRGMSTKHADQFVGMYVNDFTVDCGEPVKRAIKELLTQGHLLGLFSEIPAIEFIDLPKKAHSKAAA